MSVLVMVGVKSFNGKFSAKFDFLVGCFILPLPMLLAADIGSLKSLHTLFD